MYALQSFGHMNGSHSSEYDSYDLRIDYQNLKLFNRLVAYCGVLAQLI